MSAIIKPMGPIVRRITIEMDSAGTTSVEAHNIVLGKSVLMKPFEFVSILAQLVSSTLQNMSVGLNRKVSDAEAKSNND
jgi:hypothetical protein